MASICSKLEGGRRVRAVFECCRVRVLRRSQKGSILLGAKIMIDFGEDVGQSDLVADSSSAKSFIERREAVRITHLHCLVPVLQNCGLWQDSHRETKGRAQHGKHPHEVGGCSSTSNTFENVEDGMARWSPSAA